MYDAILCKRNFPTDDDERHIRRNKLFGPLLGVTRVKSAAIAIGDLSLVTRLDDNATFLYPKNHQRHPDLRHDWFVAVDHGDTFAQGDLVAPEDVTNHSVMIGILKR